MVTGGMAVFLFRCGGVCGGVFVLVWWCFCACVFVVVVVVFLWWCFCGGAVVFLWCFCVFVVVFLYVFFVKGRLSSHYREVMHRVLTTLCKKMSGIKVLLTLLISTLTSNISFI